jgi:hypothetical protein
MEDPNVIRTETRLRLPIFGQLPDVGHRKLAMCLNLGECQIANSLGEQCGHETFQISGFWVDYGQTCPPRTDYFWIADDSGIGGTRGFRMPYQLLDSWKALFWLTVPRFR